MVGWVRGWLGEHSACCKASGLQKRMADKLQRRMADRLTVRLCGWLAALGLRQMAFD
jgi:hypothetical protein